MVRVRIRTVGARQSADAIRGGIAPTITWIAQTFLQLVLLSIIIVGQNVQSAAADERAQATYEDADAVLHTALEIQQHMEAQDREIERILDAISHILRRDPTQLCTEITTKAESRSTAKHPRNATDRERVGDR